MLLVIGARITSKYGTPQLNVNPKDGKVIVNPSPRQYKLPAEWLAKLKENYQSNPTPAAIQQQYAEQS